MSDNVRRIEPRAVEVLTDDGQWVPATQNAWVRWTDGTWWADVEFVVRYEWGMGKHVRSLPAERVRLIKPPT